MKAAKQPYVVKYEGKKGVKAAKQPYSTLPPGRFHARMQTALVRRIGCYVATGCKHFDSHTVFGKC